MDPEDVRALLSPYYARLRTELERFGGTVEKFIGDAVMALFGASAGHEDDPERAVRGLPRVRLSQSRPSPPERFASLRDRHSPTLDPPPGTVQNSRTVSRLWPWTESGSTRPFSRNPSFSRTRRDANFQSRTPAHNRP